MIEKPLKIKKEVKVKVCKICNKEVYANTKYCYKHYKQTEKEKKQAKLIEKKLKKESTKKFQESLRKLLHKKAWKLQSEWIRRKNANPDGNVYCYTCGTASHWKEANCGHFKHDRLDFDDRNLKVQCVKCNQHLSGRLDVYASRLIEDNGLKWFKQLEKDATTYNKYDPERLKQIIDLLNKRISTL